MQILSNQRPIHAELSSANRQSEHLLIQALIPALHFERFVNLDYCLIGSIASFGVLSLLLFIAELFH
jgi:hypothetical protein